MWEITDTRGRTVRLTAERWSHICDRHPELADQRDALISSVETASIRRRGAFSGAEVLYGDNLGPARWLAVVVAYERTEGRIITAYAQTKEPKETDRL